MVISAPVVLRAAQYALKSLVPGSNRRVLEKVLEKVSQNQLALSQLTLPPTDEWRGKPALVAGGPAENAFPNSTLCRQESFEAPYFSYWTARMGHQLRYHRKLWEFIFICQALFERGYLQHNFKGLGFGVGEEPLAALFASQGCKIVGTDMAMAQAKAAGWTDTAQHAHGKEAMQTSWVCPQDMFDENVSFRNVNMNHIPSDLKDFDFCWSACALEHLGSIDKGLAFIERSIDTLRPGGVAVHTTEFNLSSDDRTLKSGSTVLFRKRDFLRLGERLAQQGHTMAPLDLDPGHRPVDGYIDLPPYREQPHLKMALAEYSTTSIGIIIQKRA